MQYKDVFSIEFTTNYCCSICCHTVRGGAGFWSLGGSNCGVVDESSPQAKLFFELHVAFGAF